MTWAWDAPTGTYKNHALSSRIRREAVADALFMQFMRAEPGYGKSRGESITITRVLQLPLAAPVTTMIPPRAGSFRNYKIYMSWSGGRCAGCYQVWRAVVAPGDAGHHRRKIP